MRRRSCWRRRWPTVSAASLRCRARSCPTISLPTGRGRNASTRPSPGASSLRGRPRAPAFKPASCRFSGSVAIARERIAERCAQGTEPGLIVSPLVEALAIDGQAHLFRACGANASLRAMELEAGRLEGEPAVREQTTHVGLEV